MFKCFFPRPLLFFTSATIWISLCTIIWFTLAKSFVEYIGFDFSKSEEPIIGLRYFITTEFIFFYIYYALSTLFFFYFWHKFSSHKWQYWSILGSSFILFTTYFNVQVMVAINNIKDRKLRSYSANSGPNQANAPSCKIY